MAETPTRQDVAEKLKRVEELTRKAKKAQGKADRGERERERGRMNQRAGSRSVQDIGTIPPVVNWQRRLACRTNLALFITTYLPYSFDKPFCPDHLSALGKAQQATLHGGLFAQAAPRGDGKSERTKATALWAMLYGHRRFALMIGSTSEGSDELLEGVRFYADQAMILQRDEAGEFTGYEPNLFPLLAEDFPEIVYPILALEGESKRQSGQRCQGAKTKIHWGGKFIAFPTVPDGNWIDGTTIGRPPGAGAKLHATGITGRVRGFNVNGRRPDLVLVDDPQTDESAASPAGSAKVERILASAVIGLAGPGKKIAGIMPCTVIQQGDAIDNILSHDKHPEWDSSRTKMVYAFPTRLERNAKEPSDPSWEEYRDIRNGYNPTGPEGSKRQAADDATLYYLRNVDKLQEGGVVAWPERFASDELDALQAAMNFYFQDRRAFFAEYQNDPLLPDLGDCKELTTAEIAGKLSQVPRYVAPLDTDTLTAFVDVQGNMLFYLVAAWRSNFTGYIIDYGTYPKQSRPYFTKADASPLLAHVTGKPGIEAQIYAGLEALVHGLIATEWKREGGATAAKLDRVMIDSGFQAEVVYQFCRRSTLAGMITPSKGQYVGATSKKRIAEGAPKPGDKHGLEWVLPLAKESRGVRLLKYDTNFWKSFVHQRLAVPMFGKDEHGGGCLSLFGKDPGAHRLFADHLIAEYRVKTASKFGEFEEWKEKPTRPDNDWLDCLAGAAVAASMQGVSLPGVHKATKGKSNSATVSFSEMQKKARGATR